MNDKKLKKIMTHYGWKHQHGKLMEEMTEFLVELSKHPEDELHIYEELTDVLVMVRQFQLFYGIKDKDVKKMAKYKIKRTMERMKYEG